MKKQNIIGVFISLAAVLFVFSMWWFNLLISWEKKFYDYKFIIRGEKEASNDIVIVGIDEDTLEKIGRWPWPRSVLARCVDNLVGADAKIIGIDIIFPEKSQDRTQDIRFAEALSGSNRAIGALYFEHVAVPVAEMVHGELVFGEEFRTRMIYPIPLFRKSFEGMGFTNAHPDNDGVLREAQLKREYDGKRYFSFNVVMASCYGDKGKKTESFFSLPEGEDTILVNYRGRQDSYVEYSFKLIYDGKFPKSWIKDKVVLIGSTAIGAFDHYPSPYDKIFPGVEFHATVIDNLLHSDYIRRCPDLFIAVLIVVFGICLGQVFLRIKPLVGAIFFLLGIVGYFCFSQYMFTRAYLHIDFLAPSLSMIFSFFGIMGYRYATEAKEKAWIKKTFSYYLSPDVIKELTANPEKLRLGGERKDLTVLFSDIRGFTTLSEKLNPEEVSNLLNEHLSAMTEIIFRHGGTLDKFVGDTVMAFWGAPVPQEDHPRKAVLCALEMTNRLAYMQEIWRTKGRPVIEIGIGINTGEMIVGNMVSKQRMDYTVIGDNVNLASRLETLTRKYNAKIIIAESTYELVRNEVEVKPLGKVRIKGKENEVTVFELLKRKDAGL
jgi:adenylate cyclase